MSVAYPTFAQENISSENNNKISGLEINYDLDKGHDNKSKDEIIEELVNLGVSMNDAEYYAKLDILAASLENNGIKIDFDEVESYPTEYATFNMLDIREKALELDKRAIKTLFEQSTILARNNEELQSNLDIQSLSSDNKATIRYPDGSSITRISEVTKIKDDDSYTTDTNYPGPWDSPYGGKDMYEQRNVYESGSFYQTNDVTFSGGAYWATINNTFSYQIRNNGSTNVENWTAHYNNSQSASSSSGFVSVTSDKAYHQGETAKGSYQFIQAYTEGRFVISGSVGGSISFAGTALNVSIQAGDSWRQYAITEVTGSHILLAWEAYYY
jgi:hypothetical protein